MYENKARITQSFRPNGSFGNSFRENLINSFFVIASLVNEPSVD